MSTTVRATSTSIASPSPSIIVVTVSTSADGAVKNGLNALYIAGIVIGVIAILVSLLSILFCFHIYRRKQITNPSGHSIGLWSPQCSKASAASSICKEDLEATAESKSSETLRTIDGKSASKSWWPKYYRISPPPQTLLSSQHRSLRAPRINDAQHSKAEKSIAHSSVPDSPTTTATNPLQQHPVQSNVVTAHGLETISSANRPHTPLKSPLRTSKSSNALQSSTAMNGPATQPPDVVPWPVQTPPSAATTCGSSLPPVFQPFQKSPPRSSRAHRQTSQPSMRKLEPKSRDDGEPVNAASSRSGAPHVRPVPVPPLPHGRRDTPKAIARGADTKHRHQSHAHHDSATDIELSEDEQVVSASQPNNKAVMTLSQTSNHGSQTREHAIAIRRTPIQTATSDRQGGVFTAGSSSPRVANVPHVMVTSPHSPKGTETPKQATHVLPPTSSPTTRNAPASAPSIAVRPPDAPSPRTPAPFSPTTTTTTATYATAAAAAAATSPASISGRSMQQDNDAFWQSSATQQTGTWPRYSRAGGKSRLRRDADSRPARVGAVAATAKAKAKIVRGDLPQSDVYDFF